MTGDSLTLQWKDPSSDQYGSLPLVVVVVVKCPTKQRLWDIFLASETFVFYIQFLQNSIQYTTNNFPNTTWVQLFFNLSNPPPMSAVQFPAQAGCFFQTLLQRSSETHPISYPKITLGSYPDSKFSGRVTVLRPVVPLQRQFTFYPRTQYDWINNGGHTYKNTTHQNIIMHYLESIFQLHCCHATNSSSYLLMSQ